MTKRKSNSRLARDRRNQVKASYHFRAGLKHLYLAAKLAPPRFYNNRSFMLSIVHGIFQRLSYFKTNYKLRRFKSSRYRRRLEIRKSNKHWMREIMKNYESLKDDMHIR